MCTIVVMRRSGSDPKVVVAANRDEFYSRAAAPAGILAERPRIVGGRDLEQGGSWLGAAATGLFVGLTNQRTFEPPDRALRSRGLVVVEALRRGSVAEVRGYLESLDARQYNSFNLIYGDAHTLEIAYARSDAAELERIVADREICVLANDRLGSRHFPKTARAAALTGPLGALGWEELAPALGGVLADHQLPEIDRIAEPPAHSPWPKALLQQLQALCIHTPAYGTRSATLIGLEPGRVSHYLFAPGPPCTSAFEDLSHLLARG